MIDARELRIGNLINANGVQIAVDFINVDLGFPEKYLINDWYEEDLEPIPLTEEWLLRCGFEKYKEKPFGYWKYLYHYRIDGFIIVLENEEFRPSNGLLPVLKTVHQLQNLYFALTATELNYLK